MPRKERAQRGGVVYHVLNCANGRAEIFESPEDFGAFERTIREARERVAVRFLSYCVMPNHWHLVLWPHGDGELSEFMRWLTMTHTQRWHAAHGSSGTGHLYQGRYKSFPVECDRHLLVVCRYVERNPLRAGLVTRAEHWRYSSLWRRQNGDPNVVRFLDEWPVERPTNWLELVNDAEEEKGFETGAPERRARSEE